MKNIILVSSLWVGFGFFGLQAMAQAAAPAFQLPASTIPSLPGGLPASKSPATKLVRVYNGAGYFDDALAERLRPMLAKAFLSSMPDPAKVAAAGTNAAPSMSEAQKKGAADHL